MVTRYILDGSNIAHDGQPHVGLEQLLSARESLMARDPTARYTVFVDSTFLRDLLEGGGSKDEYDFAVSRRLFLVVKSGLTGGGDARVVAQAIRSFDIGENPILVTNDSYRELQEGNPWLFNEDRILGGDYIDEFAGWNWDFRTPVRATAFERAAYRRPKFYHRLPSYTPPVAFPLAAMRPDVVKGNVRVVDVAPQVQDSFEPLANGGTGTEPVELNSPSEKQAAAAQAVFEMPISRVSTSYDVDGHYDEEYMYSNDYLSPEDQYDPYIIVRDENELYVQRDKGDGENPYQRMI